MPIFSESRPNYSPIHTLTALLEKSRFQPAWRRVNLEENSQWQIQIPDGVLSSALTLNRWLELDTDHRPLPDEPNIRIKHLDLLAQVLQYYLTRKTGVVLLSGLEPEEYGEGPGQLLLSQLGHELGTVIAMDRLPHDPCDRNRSSLPHRPDQPAPSVTPPLAETGSIPGVMGLLCLHAGPTGGAHRLVNLLAVYQHLLEHDPDVLQCLCPKVIGDHTSPLCSSYPYQQHHPLPIFEWGRWYQGLTCRFWGQWISAGHLTPAGDLTPTEMAAIKTFEEVVNQDEFVYTHQLAPGEILLINNHIVALQPPAHPDHGQQLVRLWVDNDALRLNPEADKAVMIKLLD